jgi:hypothetical protein
MKPSWLAFVLLCAAALATADGKEGEKAAAKAVPANLKGDWMIREVGDGDVIVGSGEDWHLKIRDDEVEWNIIPRFQPKAGKGKITAVGKENEGTLEWKIGDKVYKGIYQLFKGKERTILRILLAAEGKAAPKAFAKPGTPLVPKDASYHIECDRQNK